MTATVFSLLLTACSSGVTPAGSQQASSLELFSATDSASFTKLLESSARTSPEQLKSELRTLRQSPDTPTQNKKEAAYLLGRLLQKGGSPEEQKEIIELFNEAAQLPPLWQRCQWHIVECATSQGKEKIARAALEAIARETNNPDEQAEAAYNLAQSYLRSNETARAREAFTELRDKFPQTQYALGAAFYLGQMDIEVAETRPAALALFREYLQKSPDGHFARDIVTRMSTLKDFTPSAEDHGLFGQVHFVHGEWQAALNEWAAGGANRYWYQQAVCQARLGQTATAKASLQAGLKSHRDDPSTADAAAMLSRLSNKDQAIVVYKLVLGTSPKFADLALWNLALRHPFDQALSYYRQIVQHYPQSDYAAESQWWLTWDQARHGKYNVAIKAAQAARQKYPQAKSAPRFAFWIGKWEEQTKHADLAKAAYKQTAEQYPSEYYGYRAKYRLQALNGGKDLRWQINSQRAHPDTNWVWPQPPQKFSYQSIAQQSGSTSAMLCKLRQWDECLQVLPKHQPSLAKAYCLASLEMPLDAINVAKATLSGSANNTAVWQYAYPLLHAHSIAQASQATHLDPLLVHALIREESRYNHLAVSRSNALGLMQLLPGTAYGVAKRLGINLSGYGDIHKPENNIAMGTGYLSYVLKRFNGNAMYAVASYNGGPNAVQSWVSRFGAGDPDVFVENVPIQETRDYIRKVFGSFWNYQAIYPAN